MSLFVGVTLAALAMLVWTEWLVARPQRPTRVAPPLRAFSKTLASTGFVAAALSGGALDSGFGRWVVAALALSWMGDVALLGRGRASFLGGLASFLVAHVFFAAAFVVRGISAWWVPVAALLALPALGVLAWLRPHVSGEMRAPVVAYVAAITSMAALAVGTVAAEGNGWIVAAAFGFYISDLFVARDRFVSPGFVNRLIGLPLYYAAQLAFAWIAGRPAP